MWCALSLTDFIFVCSVFISTVNIAYFSFSKLASATCIVVNPATKQKEKGKISSAPFRHLERWVYAY